MNVRETTLRGALAWIVLATVTPAAHGREAVETYRGTATVKTAGGATASAPVTITVDRKMTQDEADALVAAFVAGGVPSLRKALEGVTPTGWIRVGTQQTVTRLTLERPTDGGRLLTILTDTPIVFLGAGLPGAASKKGYDFAVIDVVIDEAGRGAGTLSPAAKITVQQGIFVVDAYGAELIRLVDLRLEK
jgi:hypothetical protein